MSRDVYEPSARAWHYTAAVENGYSYTYGGRTIGFDANKAEISSNIEVFDHYLERWIRNETGGNPPKALYGGRCCSQPDTSEMYFYGGHDGNTWRGELHSFSSRSLQWSALSYESDQPQRPMNKIACGFVCFGRKLVVFGGYGIATGSIPDTESQFSPSAQTSLTGRLGWTNEFHLYDLETGIWSSPTIHGTIPPPCSHFTFISINNHQAIMFGGLVPGGKRMNDVYLFDFAKLEFTKLQRGNGPLPSERAYHAACCLGFGSERPCILVTGGWDNNGRTLKDAWIYDFASNRWAELDVPNETPPRQAHSATAVDIAPGLIEVTLFGGCLERLPYKSDETQLKISETVVWTFCAQNSVHLLDASSLTHNYMANGWVLVNVAIISHLGTDKRIREKIERIRRLGKEAGIRDDESQQLSYAGRQSSREVVSQSPVQVQQIVDERLMQEILAREEAERQVQIVRTRAEEAEAEARELGSQWVVQREEIQLTDEELGRGGWGVVKVANFRGMRLAAKCFYSELTSDYYLSMYNRELNMASRLRHPNMVQFIGASVNGTPIILTELMATSLRAVLQQGPIELFKITSINRDILRALNYLHLMRPHPIVHRDISSANVLLDPLPDNCWKAKVSDYGSVNLLTHTNTVGPGSPVYAAPEANNPPLQSPKMDIFSFGVLLVEMLTDQFPEISSRRRLIASINHAGYIILIELCLQDNKDNRPSAQTLLTRLDLDEFQ